MSPKRIAYRDSRRPQRRAERKAEGHPEVQRMTIAVRKSRMLSTAKIRSRDAGMPFDLTRDDVIIPSHCPVLGIELDPLAKNKADNLPTFDRIDNAKGYVKGNVWVISWRANRLKWNSTLDELRSLVRALEERTKLIECRVPFQTIRA